MTSGNGRKREELRQWGGELALRLAKSLAFWGMTWILMLIAVRGFQSPEEDRTAVNADGSLVAGIGDGEAMEPGTSAGNLGIREAGGTLPEDRGAEEASILSGGGGDTPVTEAQEEKLVALTFDDGPHPVYTAELLDGLKERGVRATFFVVGKNILGNEELIRRMDQEGHLIGNHTYDHVKISAMADEEACAQVEKTCALVKEITGKNTEFVRPPFGSWSKSLECSFVMIPVLWDVDPLDWTTKNADLVVERVLRDTEPGDIILLHDYYDSSVKAALRIVDALQAQGYEFVTADQLILE